MDLRQRVVAAVVEDGMCCHAPALRFGVVASSAIKWVRCVRNSLMSSALEFANSDIAESLPAKK